MLGWTRNLDWRLLPLQDSPTGQLHVGTSGLDATALLRAWGKGDTEAPERLLGIVYQELRRRAARHLARERPGHTLQPSALVNEAYIRLADQRRAAWENRAQFLAVASQMMRRILVDHARARLATKRSGQWTQVTLAEADEVTVEPNHIELLDVDAALSRLARFDARKSRIAELRLFGGLSLEETGRLLNLSSKTVERDWLAARAWLFKFLSRRPCPNGASR